MKKKQDGFGHEAPFQGETNDWITPKWIIKAFDTLSDSQFFSLDPCSSLTQPWIIARKAYTAEQNGLISPWGAGHVYCNPPYGNNVGQWAKKMAKHNDGIMLIFARVETSVWQDEIFPTASGFLFPNRRIAFWEFVCECGKPRSWHSGSSKKKAAASCGNYRQTKDNRAVESDAAGAPSAFVAWGDDCRAALIELCDNGGIPGAFLDMAFYTGSYHSEEEAREARLKRDAESDEESASPRLLL